MAFQTRREYLFVYSVQDANPNGDPLNSNHPRYDEDTRQILVSDVRIKRTIRDQWLREGRNVFVDGEAKTLKTRVDELKSILNRDTGREVMGECIDTRLFGVTFALGKESFSWVGPVQFKWGRSLHRAKVELVQGTAAFVSRDGSEQRSFRNEYIVPFVVMGVYGIANQYPSRITGAEDQDLERLRDGLWEGTTNLITRSKVGHQPLLLLEVRYREGYNGAIGSLDQKIQLRGQQAEELTADQQMALRTLSSVSLDISPLMDRLNDRSEEIDRLFIWHDRSFTVPGLSELRSRFAHCCSVEER